MPQASRNLAIGHMASMMGECARRTKQDCVNGIFVNFVKLKQRKRQANRQKMRFSTWWKKTTLCVYAGILCSPEDSGCRKWQPRRRWWWVELTADHILSNNKLSRKARQITLCATVGYAPFHTFPNLSSLPCELPAQPICTPLTHVVSQSTRTSFHYFAMAAAGGQEVHWGRVLWFISNKVAVESLF